MPGPPPLPPPLPDERKPRTGLFVGLSVGLLAVLLILLFLLARLLGFGSDEQGVRQVEVDNVLNRPAEEAERTLRDKGFTVNLVDQPNDTAPSGTVVNQDPKGGTEADEGSLVTLFVARATNKVPVPGVLNQKQEDAEAALRAAGLEPRVEEVKNTTVSEGFVFEQDPQPNTEVDKGSVVTIRVSSGDGLPPVPEVIGLPVLEATNRLTQAGFTTRNIEENSPTAPAGTVTRTDPPVGSKLPKGETRVTLYVSRGAPTTTVGKVLVPSVVGRSEATARSELTRAGFNVQVQSSPGGGTVGRVKAQNPAGNTRVDAGSTVTITVVAPATTSTSAPATTTTTVPGTTTTPTT